MDFCEKREKDKELKAKTDALLKCVRNEKIAAPEHSSVDNLTYRYALMPFYWLGELLCFIPRQALYWIIRKIDTYIEYEATIKICVGPFLYFFYALLLLFVIGISLWWFPLVLFVLYAGERVRKEMERVRRTMRFREMERNSQIKSYYLN
jgi:hypothetical protein